MRLLIGLAALWAAQGLDFATTYAGLASGAADEANPVAGAIIRHTGWVGFGAAKIAAVIVLTRIFVSAYRRQPRMATVVLAVAAGTLGAVGLTNLYVILGAE